MIGLIATLSLIFGASTLFWVAWDLLFEDGVLRRGGKHKRCLAHIEALERELMPWLFTKPEATRPSKHDELSFAPGSVWPVDHHEDIQFAPQMALQRAQAIEGFIAELRR